MITLKQLKQLKSKLERDFGWENLESDDNKWFVDNLLKDTIQAIEVIRCCTELKDKQPMTFEEWLNFNKYTKKTIGYERNQIRFGYEEMMQRYIGYKQSL